MRNSAMKSMVITQPSTSVDSNCHLNQNNGNQLVSQDEIVQVESFTTRLPCYLAADPLLLPTLQEVSKEELQEYERKRKGSKQLSFHHTIAMPPTPSIEAGPNQKIQQSGQHGTLTHPINHRSLHPATEQEPIVATTTWKNTSPSEHHDKQKNCKSKSCHPPPCQAGGTIAQEHKNDCLSGGGHNKTGNKQAPPETRKLATSSGLRALPKNFVPKPWSVVLGRDRASLRAPGNNHLRRIVRQHLERYAKCGVGNKKLEKTLIISEIEFTIRRNCSTTQDHKYEEDQENELGAFIKFQDGRWWEVTSSDAREKIGRLLRESLHTKYSSSSKSKRARMQLRLKATRDLGKQSIPSS